MSNSGGFGQSAQYVNQSTTGFPILPAEALEGVRTRRVIALLLDILLVSILSSVVYIALLILTLGLSLFLPFALAPVIGFFYNGVTISGWRRATPGMRAMDLEVQMRDGASVPFINAAFQGLLFWLTMYISSGFVLAVSLFNRDKRCLHDIFSGVVVVRRFQP